MQAAGPLEPKIVVTEIDKGAVGLRSDGRAPARCASLRPQQRIQFSGPMDVDVDLHRGHVRLVPVAPAGVAGAMPGGEGNGSGGALIALAASGISSTSSLPPTRSPACYVPVLDAQECCALPPGAVGV